MNRKAFTLIELLVVIAIIAILAAILFPVFAQAKVAAKKTASLSNTKQTALAAIMYSGDADDYFVLSMSGSYAGVETPNLTSPLTNHANTWVYLLQPYIKSLTMMVDTGMGDAANVWGSGPNAWYGNQNRFPQYGYNYMFLGPWYNCDYGLARNNSAAVKPAETVMFTTSQEYSQTPTIGWYASNAPGAWPVIAPAPFACIWYFGSNLSPAGATGNWSANNPASVGRITSSVETKIYNQGANVAWVDGHAKYLKDGNLAIGTDYMSAAYNNANSGAQITNLSTYLWSLDGTLNDLKF